MQLANNYQPFIADFHIHSKYSHATSKYMDIAALTLWGQLKGITLMGTGDFTHPLWQKELSKNLQEAEPGLWMANSALQDQIKHQLYDSCLGRQRFILSAEVSTIFKRGSRCYRTHSIILAPSFVEVEKISKRLGSIGNIVSDGRPILGCDVKDIVKIVLDASSDCMIIPAHVWTPWYGLLGSKSGFDSVNECFQELTEYIYAVETGLSSNFAMNAQLSELDRFALLCNSDAHSVQKLGREANIMATELSYQGVIGALRRNNPDELRAGIEFFPERGKYYADGHRKCNVCMLPEQTIKQKGICSVCNKAVTIGVLHRVQQLADRTESQARSFIRKSLKIVPLLDILSFHLQVAETSKKVQKLYHCLLQSIGPEFYILLEAPIEQIAACATVDIAASIKKMRASGIEVQPGFDGMYGKIIL